MARRQDACVARVDDHGITADMIDGPDPDQRIAFGHRIAEIQQNLQEPGLFAGVKAVAHRGVDIDAWRE